MQKSFNAGAETIIADVTSLNYFQRKNKKTPILKNVVSAFFL